MVVTKIVVAAGYGGPEVLAVQQVDVPAPGRYRISASSAGARQEHWVDLVPQGGARLSLRWQE